jgi:cell wall-associated NlpC family hydrolase
VRVRSLGAVLCSVTIAALGASNAFAAGPGGVAAVEPPSSAGGSSTTSTATPPHAAPVTAKTPNVAYKGPVYEKTVTGEVVPYTPPSVAGEAGSPTGGAAVAGTAEGKPELLVPGTLARYVDGLAAAPESAPAAVQEIIWAGNQLIGLPYIYGGGHASFVSPGYDCSGTVSFALHGGDLLSSPEDSSEFMAFGSAGVGRWVTIFTNPGHAYMTVAGLRLDTSAADDPTNEQGPRWRPLRQSNGGFTVRHPIGL